MTDAASNLSERQLADLAALADGSLPAERRAEVEAWVAASPERGELLARQQRALAATHALAEEPIPESLFAAVEADRGARGVRQGRARRLAPRLALAGALAVAVAVVAALLSVGPAAPSVAEAASVAERAPSGPAPPPLGTEGTQLALDVDGVVFPDLLEEYGWRAVGVRRDEVDGRDTTTVFYEKEGTRIAYVIVAGDALTAPSDAPKASRNGVVMRTLRVDGRVAVTWQRLGRTCILVGSVPTDELLTLASWRGDGTLDY